MIADLLLCWYALGWIACGLNFALLDKYVRAPVFMCLLMPTLVIFLAILSILIRCLFALIEQAEISEQYLWRKP